MADYPSINIEYVWLFLNMSEYAWICRIMPGCDWIYLNGFSLTFSQCNHWSTWKQGQCLHKTRRNMKEHEAVFLNRKNVIFSIMAGSIWFVFCKRPNILTSKIWNLFLFFWSEEAEARESWRIWNYHRMNKSLNIFQSNVIYYFNGATEDQLFRERLICNRTHFLFLWSWFKGTSAEI